MKLPVLMTAMFVAASAFAQDAVDAGLLADINRIRAIDNHMHGDPVDGARAARWQDATPPGKSRYPEVVARRPTNPDWRTAWFSLYGYSYQDAEPAHLRDLLAAKRSTLARAGTHWPSNVLDAAGVDIALLNTVRPGAGQLNGRFRWVPYADPLLRPFAAETSWLAYAGGELTAASLFREVGFNRAPPTLAEYRVNIVQGLLARWKKSGAVAVKFLCAQARSLDFDVVDEPSAAAVYAKAAANPASLTAAEGKLLEDYLFGAIAAAAAAQQLAVHVHTGAGDRPYDNHARANPALLERQLNSRAQRQTNFVLLHGGWPWHVVAQALSDKPNTFVDFSAQASYLGAHQLAAVLRDWLAWQPEKVLFGSDARSGAESPLNDWEEQTLLATAKARRALAIALTAMIRNGEISRERALEIARLVLRGNTLALHGLGAAAAPASTP